MFFENLSRLRKTLGFRLTVWYAAVFTMSAVVLLGLAYLFLASSLQAKDRESIHLKLMELRTRYAKEGLNGLKQAVGAQGRIPRTRPFFIRLAEPGGKTVLVQIPDEWAPFDFGRLERATAVRTGEWVTVGAADDENLLEIETARLPNGLVLQVGRSTEDRQNLLERFRQIVAGVMLGVIGLAVTGGAFLAVRSLRPIRGLIRTVQTIEAGSLAARVATRGTGDELDELGALFNRMLDRIEMLIQGMRGALDNVAHDLRTPMTRLRGSAELALRSNGNVADHREALGECVEEADRLLTMLNTLMDISEAETGTLKLDRQPVHLATAVEGVVELYSDLAEDKRLTITTTLPDDLWVLADRPRLQQVVGNLFDNAVKYTAPGGRIALIASRIGGDVRIVVEDTGIGISPADLPKIWDRLYRGDQSRSQRGLGLGLSLVKAVVQAHGGTIQVSSQPGVGTQFILAFPAAVPASQPA